MKNNIIKLSFLFLSFGFFACDDEINELQPFIEGNPDHLLTHDNTAAIIQKIKPELDEYGVYDNNLSVIVLDHVIPAASEKTAINHKVKNAI